MNLRDDLIAKLEAENDDLRERLRLLEKSLGIRIETPLMLGLTGAEAKVFGILLKREMVTKQQAMDVLYGDRAAEDEEAEIKIVDVFVCKLRKKLKRFNIAVETVWGRGYRMSAQAKAIAAQLLEESRGS